jgi:surface antigen
MNNGAFAYEAGGHKLVNTLRALLVVLTVGLMWAPTTAAQVNPFGDSLDLKDSDVAMLQAAASALFQDDNARIGQTETWSNPKTGNSGAVSLLQLFKRADMPCKRLQHTIRQKGRADQITYQFARCRAGDGSWKLL